MSTAKSAQSPLRTSANGSPQPVTKKEILVWWAESAESQSEKPVRTLQDLCLGAVFPRVKAKSARSALALH